MSRSRGASATTKEPVSPLKQPTFNIRVSEIVGSASVANVKAHPSLAHIEKTRPSIGKEKSPAENNTGAANSRDVASNANVESQTPVEQTITSHLGSTLLEPTLEKNGSMTRVSIQHSQSKKKLESRADILRRSQE